MRNPNGLYGSEWSTDSANNPYAVRPPIIYKYGEAIHYLTENEGFTGTIPGTVSGVSLAAIDYFCQFTSTTPQVSGPPGPTAWVDAADGEHEERLDVRWGPVSRATSYNVYYSTFNGGYQKLGAVETTSAYITGLERGRTYYIAISAVNSSGESAKIFDTGYLAGGAPAAPTISSIEAGDGFAFVNVSISDSGGSEITEISVDCRSGGLTYSGKSASSPVLVSGLLNGQTYQCSARATNVNGTGPESSAVSVVLPQTMPLKPTIASTSYGDGELTIFVSESVQLTTVDSYEVTCTDGTNTYAGTSTSSPITVSGLTNGVAYTCTVTATNSVGKSSASAATAPITPEETSTGLPIWLLYQISK